MLIFLILIYLYLDKTQVSLIHKNKIEICKLLQVQSEYIYFQKIFVFLHKPKTFVLINNLNITLIAKTFLKNVQ